MGSVMPLPGELVHDKRSIHEWMEDQGLGKPKVKIKNVSWVERSSGQRRPLKGMCLSFRNMCLLLSPELHVALNAEFLRLGSGTLEGKLVIVLKPSTETEGGHKITMRRVTAARPLKQLKEAGLKYGRYKVYSATGGYYAVLLEDV